MGYIDADGNTRTTTAPHQDPIPLAGPELAVAKGTSAWSCRTITAGGVDYRVAAVPTSSDGIALVVAQSLEPNEKTLDKLGLVMASSASPA